MLGKFVKCALVGACLATFGLQAANADTNFPRKQLNIVVPYAPGGASDTVARIYGKEMEKVLGKPVTVTNRTGASGAVGLESVKNSRPDGYTIAYMPVESTMISALGLSTISSNDFTFICRVMTIPAAITVKADAPWNTLEEFLADAKKNPGKIMVGNSGAGSIWHVASAALGQAAGVQFNYVPFDAGQFKVLAVLGDKRSNVVPDVKTSKELGLDVTAMGWGGFAVPKGTPEDVVKVLVDASAKAVQTDAVKNLLKERGFEYAYLNGADTDAFAKDQLAKYNVLIPQLLNK